jgi:NAD(P)-dependent dehydrogenase (short-subunit alcohol dehydrogenase family)
MSELRFDGRVAVITGAGGNPSIGRAHALLLAARGAKVVVNDIGRDPETPGYEGSASAEAVAEEIRAAGGEAVADSHSVAEEAGCEALIQLALDTYGRIDILINNAGISIPAAFDAMTSRDWRRHVEVNLLGPVWTCRAAWPHFKAAGYGRIVNTCSGAMAGFKMLTAYGASKGGLWSLTRALAAEGAEHGIKANALNPGAWSRMIAAQQHDSSAMVQHARANLPADLVAPVAAFLAHQDCPASGACIEAVGGEARMVYMAQTNGISDPGLTLETVAARWEEIVGDASGAVIEAGAMDPADWDLRPYAAAEGEIGC